MEFIIYIILSLLCGVTIGTVLAWTKEIKRLSEDVDELKKRVYDLESESRKITYIPYTDSITTPLYDLNKVTCGSSTITKTDTSEKGKEQE